MKTHDSEMLMQLLADRATEGLLPEQESELRRMLQKQADLDELQFDLAAAATHISQPITIEPMPSSVRSKVVVDANVFFSGPSAETSAIRNLSEENNPNIVPFPVRHAPASSFNWNRAGWLVAAAAMLLAVLGWWPQFTTRVPKPRTIAEERASLLAKGNSAIAWAKTPSPEAQSVQGDVVWSDAEQKGYMRFTGLPALDPNTSVYQLWIFDKEQDERYPIDGGVFTVNANGEVIVPIDAKIAVRQATLFAITIEKPGGVVVSKRDRLVLTAKV